MVTLIPVFADSQGRVIVSGSKSGKVFKKSALLARVREMVARNLCVVAPLLPDIAIASARLEDFHGDPADRIIVATARHTGSTLVTADGKILAWATVVTGRLAVLPF